MHASDFSAKVISSVRDTTSFVVVTPSDLLSAVKHLSCARLVIAHLSRHACVVNLHIGLANSTNAQPVRLCAQCRVPADCRH